METKHKNMLIISLLAIVLVMAVGYAAFAQSLKISGTANITSKWEVHFDENSASYQTSSLMGTTPTATVTVGKDGLTAEFEAELISPGDTVTYTIPVVNTGTINAKLTSINLSGENLQVNQQNLTATSTDGNIKYTVTSPGTGVLQNTNGKANVIIKSEFVNKTSGNTNAYGSQAKLTVSLTYAQG